MKLIESNTTETEEQSIPEGVKDWRLRECSLLATVAFITDTPESQLRKLCRSGEINPITGFGRKWRIATTDIERLLQKRLRNN
jgi:hypothetical protein